jgi:ribonuclease HI
MLSGLIIFCDGSSRGNPGPGGYGALALNMTAGTVVEYGAGKKLTTNNEMELQALLTALQGSVGYVGDIHIYADSQYVYQGATKWIYGWRKNGWVKKDKEPITHVALWQNLVEIMDQYRSDGCEFIWHHVPSHSGIAGNERVDTIATMFADGEYLSLYQGPLDHYPLPGVMDVPSDESLARTRQEKKVKKSTTGSASSKGSSAFYISLVDGKLERHAMWAECEKRVKGTKGARFKKVASEEEASRIVLQWTSN